MLVPNTELGHLELDGEDAEKRAAASARDREELSWKEWAGRVEHYLAPRRPAVHAGADHRRRRAPAGRPTSGCRTIDVDCEVVPAALTNEAGIVGAAIVGSLDQPLT